MPQHRQPNYGIPLALIYRQQLIDAGEDPDAAVIALVKIVGAIAYLVLGVAGICGLTEHDDPITGDSSVTWYGWVLSMLFVVGSVSAVVAYAFFRDGREQTRHTVAVRRQMAQEEARRDAYWRFYSETLGEMLYPAEREQLESYREPREWSFAEQEWLQHKVDRWDQANPATYEAQVRARQEGFLCRCDPNAGHRCLPGQQPITRPVVTVVPVAIVPAYPQRHRAWWGHHLPRWQQRALALPPGVLAEFLLGH